MTRFEAQATLALLVAFALLEGALRLLEAR